MERANRNDEDTAIEGRFSGYSVYDPDGDRIGKVDYLFLDENDNPEYIGVRMGFLGLKSTLIPMVLIQIDERREALEVSQPKRMVKDAPAFDDDEEITPEFEERVRSHFGLQSTGTDGWRGYGEYYGDEEGTAGRRTDVGRAGPGITMGDRDRDGEFRQHPPEEEGVHEREDDLNDTDELRVQRSEEELRAGTREREAGTLNVRKRVRTDREQLRVPTRHEEVHVERVPVDEEGTGVEIGDDEISVPVVEEEVVVDKRPVVKEEVRVRKEAVEDEEVVEEDVRREEVDVEVATGERRRDGIDDV